MAKKFLSGSFQPQNPDKYVGGYPITYRSSWELVICRMLDEHQNIIQWASESIKIPYTNPLTGKYTVYVPDFTVLFEDRNGNTRLELWEIKPRKQTFVGEAKKEKDKLALAVNAAKWKAAQKWANDRGAVFRVINEDSIFRNYKGK
jgi:hypothetical protein